MVKEMLHVDLNEEATFSSITLKLISKRNGELAHNLIINLPVDISISFLCLKNEHFKLVFSVGHVDWHAVIFITLTLLSSLV